MMKDLRVGMLMSQEPQLHRSSRPELFFKEDYRFQTKRKRRDGCFRNTTMSQ